MIEMCFSNLEAGGYRSHVPVDSVSGEDPFLKHRAINGRKDGNTNRTGNIP